MRQFDRELHDQDPETQNRLWEVLERYTDWVNRLPEADQKRIEQAADRNERLAIVKELRRTTGSSGCRRRTATSVAALPEADRPSGWPSCGKRTGSAPGMGGLGQCAEGAPQPAAAAPHGALPEVPNKVLTDFFNAELTRRSGRISICEARPGREA